MQPKTKGILWAIVSMLLWAAGFPAGRLLLNRGLTDPITLGMLRFFFGGVLMLGIGRALKVKGLFDLSFKNTAAYAVLGLVGTAMMGFLLLYAQKTVSAVNSAMIEAESPLMICLLGIFVLRKISVMQIVGLLFGFFGCLMVTGVITAQGLQLQSFQFGDGLIALSALCWSLYTVFGTKIIAKTGAYAFTAWTMLFGSLWLALLAAASPASLLLPAATEFGAWAIIAFYIVFPTVIAFYAWNQALIYISPALLSLSEYFTPFCTAVIAYFWLGESLSGLQIAGALIICGSVLIEPEIAELIKKEKARRMRAVFQPR